MGESCVGYVNDFEVCDCVFVIIFSFVVEGYFRDCSVVYLILENCLRWVEVGRF